MKNQITKRIDPWTQEVFIPRRTDQKFACLENKVAYNNHIGNERRKEMLHAYKLATNHQVLLSIIPDKFYKRKRISTLIRKGFDFNYFTEYAADCVGDELVILHNIIIVLQGKFADIYNMDNPSDDDEDENEN